MNRKLKKYNLRYEYLKLDELDVREELEKYIEDFMFIKNGIEHKIRIFIKYDHKGESVISGINRVSKPGKRVYVNQNELPRVLDGLGISILSTSKGVISNKVAKRIGVGGEVLCSVW